MNRKEIADLLQPAFEMMIDNVYQQVLTVEKNTPKDWSTQQVTDAVNFVAKRQAETIKAGFDSLNPADFAKTYKEYVNGRR